VISWKELGRSRAPDGGQLVLRMRDDEFVIRIDGRELMSSRAHGSEEEMARLACAKLPTPDAPRVLIGGLGMGYTLRAALDVLPAGASVTVAEIVRAVVDWNREHIAHLAGAPLDDPRVTVHTGDVGALLRKGTVRWDAIMLDVDNGPQAITRPANQLLYSPPGLEMIRHALRRGGTLAVWSADRDPRFVALLAKQKFEATSVDVPARGRAGGPAHTIFLARVPA
jgi:spermidine synthase